MNSSEQQRALLETQNHGSEVNMLAKRHGNLQKAVSRAMDKFKGDDIDPLAEEVITRVVFKILGQYQSKVNVGMQDSVSELLSAFKHKVAANIFETADSWRVKNKNAILFPAGCRYLYTRGTSTIAMIEQPPQIRTLLFRNRSMLDGSANTGRYGYTEDSQKRVCLSLPYVYFFLSFRDRENDSFYLEKIYSAWRSNALTKLDDFMSLPLLPNVHSNGEICMGTGAAQPLDQSVSHLTSKAISNYWNSCFTNELSDYWWGKGSVDKRIMTGNLWAKNTELDPTFIYSLRFRNDYTAKHIIDRLAGVEEMPDETTIRHKLTSVIDDCVETLYVKIIRYFKNTKFERFYPKTETKVVSDSLVGVVQEMNDVLLALEHEIDKLGESVKDLHPGMHWKKRGDFWEDSY